MVDVLAGGAQGGAAGKVGFDHLIRAEHIEELFASQLADEESFPLAGSDQSFMLENRQRFPTGVRLMPRAAAICSSKSGSPAASRASKIASLIAA